MLLRDIAANGTVEAALIAGGAHDFLATLTAVFSLVQHADCVAQQAAFTSQQSAAAEPQQADGGSQQGACSAQQPELADGFCMLLYV